MNNNGKINNLTHNNFKILLGNDSKKIFLIELYLRITLALRSKLSATDTYQIIL